MSEIMELIPGKKCIYLTAEQQTPLPLSEGGVRFIMVRCNEDSTPDQEIQDLIGLMLENENTQIKFAELKDDYHLSVNGLAKIFGFSVEKKRGYYVLAKKEAA